LKSSILALAVFLRWGLVALATAFPLTSLLAVHSLTHDKAIHSLPVQIEATVVYLRGDESLFFVQGEDAAIFVRHPAGIALLPGDRSLERGTTTESTTFVRQKTGLYRLWDKSQGSACR
jgi:hypothetical protein